MYIHPHWDALLYAISYFTFRHLRTPHYQVAHYSW